MMTNHETRILFELALAGDEAKAWELLEDAGPVLAQDEHAIEQLKDLVCSPAERRLLEAKFFPMRRHALGK